MNCNDFIKTTEMQIFVVFRGISKSDNKTCYIAYLWYIYSLICSVRKTEMTNTSFDKYYSHTVTDSILLDLYLKFLWEALSQKMKAEKNRSKKTLHEPVKRMKKEMQYLHSKKKKNTALTQQRLCTYSATTAPLPGNGSGEKNCLCTVPLCCHVSLPGDAQHAAADLPQFFTQVVVRGHPRAARGGTVTEHAQHREGQTIAITLCVAFEQTFGTTKITVWRKINKTALAQPAKMGAKCCLYLK